MLPFKQTSVLYFDFRGTFSELNRFASPNQYWTPSCSTKEKEPLLLECVNNNKVLCKFPLNGISGYGFVPPKISYFGMAAMQFLCIGLLLNQFNISRDNLL